MPPSSLRSSPGGLTGSRVLFSPIDQARALRTLGGSQELLQRALHRFATGELPRVDMLGTALVTRDWKALHTGAHALRGSASAIAANALASACGRLQEMCREDGSLRAGVAEHEVTVAMVALRGEAERLRIFGSSGGAGMRGTAGADVASGTDADTYTGAQSERGTSWGSAGSSAALAAGSSSGAAPGAVTALSPLLNVNEVVRWAREQLRMTDKVCDALLDANVDGEDAMAFDDEQWEQLAEDYQLSRTVVNKLKRKCRAAATAAAGGGASKKVQSAPFMEPGPSAESIEDV